MTLALMFYYYRLTNENWFARKATTTRALVYFESDTDRLEGKNT